MARILLYISDNVRKALPNANLQLLIWGNFGEIWLENAIPQFIERKVKMKNYMPFLLIVFIGILISGCKPDLIVTTIEMTGSPYRDAGTGSDIVPIRFVVKNIGGDSAGIFKVSTEYTDSTGKIYTVAFDDPSTSLFDWYQFTTAPLAGGSEKEFKGNVIFHPSVAGVTVPIRAIADSGSGDESMPSYIRVDESNENNNKSSSLSAALP